MQEILNILPHFETCEVTKLLMSHFFLSQGVLSRFSQINPKVIFSVEAVHYNGKQHDHLEKLRSVVQGMHIINECQQGCMTFKALVDVFLQHHYIHLYRRLTYQ